MPTPPPPSKDSAQPRPRRRARPLDDTIRDRLNLPPGSNLRLTLLRDAVGVADGIARTLTQRPFFAVREAEEMLERLEGKTGKELVDKMLEQEGGTTIRTQGIENVPKSGGAVICSTHPTGSFDFFVHGGALLEHRPDLKVVANQESARYLGPELQISVGEDPRNPGPRRVQARHEMVDHVENGGALLIFGSGRVSSAAKGKLLERDWKRGATLISKATDAPMIPAAVGTKLSPAYYRTRQIATTLSLGNDDFGTLMGSLRYFNELLTKLGGTYEARYGTAMAPGSAPAEVKAAAEHLAPELYGD